MLQKTNTAKALLEVSGLSEVVVTGYSGQQRKTIVGAVTSIKGEQLATVQTGNVENDPLYVVDGIPTTNIDFLNGNDIESTNVLKDASSASTTEFQSKLQFYMQPL